MAAYPFINIQLGLFQLTRVFHSLRHEDTYTVLIVEGTSDNVHDLTLLDFISLTSVETTDKAGSPAGEAARWRALDALRHAGLLLWVSRIRLLRGSGRVNLETTYLVGLDKGEGNVSMS